jgi:Fe-S cluster assembly protein SufD
LPASDTGDYVLRHSYPPPVPAYDQETLAAIGAGDPEWRRDRRQAAAAALAATPMPDSAEEIWRYIDLDFDLDDYAPATAAGTPLGDDPLLEVAAAAAIARVADGSFLGDDLDVGGVTVSSLRRAGVGKPELVESVIAESGLDAVHDRFALAASAFGGDGAFLHVPTGTVGPGAFYLDVQATQAETASFPRLVVAADDGSEASVVVHLRSPAGSDLVVVPQIVVAVGANATLSITVVQDWGYATNAVGNANAVVGRDGTLRFAEVGLGGELSRLHLGVTLHGDGSSAQIVGAYFGEEQQTLDYRYFMRHVGRNTRSDMFLKGAVEDEARSVFTGMIRIEETGKKTEAFQTNRNLILTEGASAQSVPNLEILANDVKCGHGSTVGPLDANQRYYLMTRGLGTERADRLQVHGFFDEALVKLPHQAIMEPLADRIDDKFATAQRAGRV